jgi:hypothetical protein
MNEPLTKSNITETYNPDFEVYLPLESGSANRNNIEIKVRSKKLGTTFASQTFPSFTSFSSGTYLPYLVIVGLYDDVGGVKKPLIDTEPILSDNEACLDAPFTYAVANARNVNEDSAASAQSDPAAAAAASCGTIEPPSGGGPGSSLPLMMLGFFLAILASSLMKSRKKFLS